MEIHTFTIGNSTQGISIKVLRRSHPTATDFWDGNWLSATAVFSLERFNGSIAGDIRAEEIVAFQKDIKVLYASLSGTAEFATMEGWLRIKLIGDKLGHIECTGFVMDEPGIGNRLNFRIPIDQSYLPSVMQSLDLILAAFRVIGKP